jgi:putative acetyltransferase
VTLRVRPEAAADGAAVLEVIRAAFGDQGDNVADIWAELRGSDLERASLVADLDGEVVGHVGLSHAWLDARRRLVDVWLLSPLAVVPQHQDRAIGSTLVDAAVAAARAGGAPLLFLEGSPVYYGRRGFERASDHGFAPASSRTPDGAFQVVRLPAHEEWMTGRVVYPDVWWRHDAAGLRDPDLAELEAALGRSR